LFTAHACPKNTSKHVGSSLVSIGIQPFFWPFAFLPSDALSCVGLHLSIGSPLPPAPGWAGWRIPRPPPPPRHPSAPSCPTLRWTGALRRHTERLLLVPPSVLLSPEDTGSHRELVCIVERAPDPQYIFNISGGFLSPRGSHPSRTIPSNSITRSPSHPPFLQRGTRGDRIPQSSRGSANRSPRPRAGGSDRRGTTRPDEQEDRERRLRRDLAQAF